MMKSTVLVLIFMAQVTVFAFASWAQNKGEEAPWMGFPEEVVTEEIDALLGPGQKTNADVSNPSRRVRAKVRLLNLREGPTTQSSVLAQVPQGTVLEVVEEAGQWLKVRYRHPTAGPIQGYVAGWLVEPVETPSVSPEEAKAVSPDGAVQPPSQPPPKKAPDVFPPPGKPKRFGDWGLEPQKSYIGPSLGFLSIGPPVIGLNYEYVIDTQDLGRIGIGGVFRFWRDATVMATVRTTVSNTAIGVQGNYHFKLSNRKFDLWAGLILGYDATTVRAGILDIDFEVAYGGFFLMPHGGVRYWFLPRQSLVLRANYISFGFFVFELGVDMKL